MSDVGLQAATQALDRVVRTFDKLGESAAVVDQKARNIVPFVVAPRLPNDGRDIGWAATLGHIADVQK